MLGTMSRGIAAKQAAWEPWDWGDSDSDSDSDSDDSGPKVSGTESKCILSVKALPVLGPANMETTLVEQKTVDTPRHSADMACSGRPVLQWKGMVRGQSSVACQTNKEKPYPVAPLALRFGVSSGLSGKAGTGTVRLLVALVVLVLVFPLICVYVSGTQRSQAAEMTTDNDCLSSSAFDPRQLHPDSAICVGRPRSKTSLCVVGRYVRGQDGLRIVCTETIGNTGGIVGDRDRGKYMEVKGFKAIKYFKKMSWTKAHTEVMLNIMKEHFGDGKI